MTKEMNKRITSLFLAFTMLLQIFLPQNIFAEGDKSLPQDKYVKVGMLDGKSYDAKIMNELNRIAAKNRKSSPGKPGFSLFSKGPYFGDNNEPKDEDKPKYFGNVSAKLDLKGLDGNEFQWNEIFGVDESGNPKPAQIIFRQMDAESSTDTGIEYILQITKGGKYTWSDGEGKPTKLPLFSKSLKPYRYEVRIDERVSDKVKLLTEVIFGTEGSSPTFSPENAEGEIIANITLGLTYQQIASTKFKSEWHTDVVETDRPGMKANFAFDDEGDGLSPVSVELPKNDKDTKIIRDWLNDFDPDLVMSIYLEKTPDVIIDETPAGLTFEEADGVKTVKSGDHKFKYDFTYDVIDGGKLTMTEIIPVTFNANGGKFENVTAPDTETKIVKEVEYGKDLTDMPEDPTKDRETFKGWGIKDESGTLTPVKDADYQSIKAAKTFYAIWEDKAFTADGLTVHESFKDDSGYVNDFIPTIEQLKGQVKVDGKDLAKQDQLAILNDDGQPLTDETAIKDYLYTKLGEENDNKVDRTVEIKGRVTDAEGKTHDVTIPIKVNKNIYEAMTEEGKPNYVPEGYVKVTLDPTTKAVEPQKYFYYVNPKAQVVIPGKDPVGTEGNNFVNWTMKTDSAPPDAKGDVYTLANRNKFAEASTITAQYVDNVVEQEGKDKPNVPDDFVKVIVDTTDQASKATRFRKTFWVKKKTPVRIIVDNPVAADAEKAFSKWRTKQYDGSNTVIDLNVDQTFSKEETFIKAFYSQLAIKQEDGLPKPDNVPDNFIKIVFDTTEKAKDPKQFTWWVAPKNERVQLKVASPTGKEVTDGAGNILYAWSFDDRWESKNNKLGRKQIVDGDSYIIDTTNFTDGEIFYAQYTTSNVIPYDPANPIDQPEGYVNVTFKAETGLSLKDAKAYYVKKNAGVTLKTIKDDTTRFGYPTVKEKAGYAFDTWDPAEDTEIKDKDILVTAKAKHVSDVIEKKDGVDQPQGYVEVTFDPTDKATDQTKRIFWVNPEKEVTIPVTDPKGTTYYTFEEWKIGANADGDVYKPTVGKKFTEDTIITATYKEAANIIPYDPKEPITRPDGYVRVTFEAEEGISLSNVKAYYVKKGANITLGNPKLVKPTTTAKTGYEFDKWDKDNSLVLGDADVVVKALAKKLPDTIEKKEGEQKPDGYVEVKFVAGENGTVEEKAYYVNPNKYVTLTPPAAKGNTGYEFGSWSPDATKSTQYTKPVTTITAKFNPIDAVIPKTKTDDSEKPAGYKTVTFVIEGKGGSIVDGQTKVYYVDPNREVTLQAPQTNADTGYVFEKWDNDTTTAKKYTDDTTVKGNFKKLDDIIPSTNDQGKPNAKPDGYITVTFDKGDHGKEITGQTVYYVNPKADPAKTIGEIKKPTVKAETGWKTNGWDKADTDKITGMQDITVTAQYTSIADIVPGGEPKPEGYITVTFEKGNHGKELTGQAIYYVNPNKAVALDDKAPKVTPNTGYDFAGWDTQIEKKIQYSNGDVITALYNEKGDVIPQEKTDGTDKPAGYLTVTFDKGEHGTLSGKTVYYVKPNKEVTVPAPTVKPDTGWKQKDGSEAWDESLTQTFNKDKTITAQYDSIDDIVPGDQAKPDGYVTITFKAVNGSLTGTTTYYVNPKVSVDLTKAANGLSKTPNVGYKDTGSWNPANLSGTFTADTTFTFTFDKLDDVIPATEGQTKPKGYVTVQFLAGNNGSLEGQTVYYVNPEAGVTIGDAAADKVIATPTPKSDADYAFNKWLPEIDKTNPITRDQNYVAQFVYNPATVTLTYKAPDKTSGDVPGAQTVKKGDKVILADANTLKKDNATFKGWMIDGKEYAAGASVTLNENTTATAVWTTNSHTVEFNTMGGSYIPSQKVAHGSKIEPVNPPTKPGHTFTGWTTSDGKSFNPETDSVTSEITLVANYVLNVVEQPDPNDDNTKPVVPDNFVKVTVDPTDKATDPATKVFWVNPNEMVQIPADQPTGKKDGDTTYVFDSWNPSLIGKFSRPTTIEAQYKKQTPLTPIFDPRITTGVVATDLNKQPPLDAYKDQIKSDKDFELVDIVEQPKVNESGFTSAKIKIRFTENGMTKVVDVLVYVKPDPVIIEKPYPVPGDCNNSCDQPNVGKDALNTTDHYQYLIGYPDGNFGPNKGMTRAEAATMFTRLLRQRPVKGQRYNAGLTDIHAGDWYANTVGYAVQRGIVSGYPDGSFKPNKPITRAEFAAIASRFDALAQGNDIAFSDLAPSHWGYAAIRSAATKGWISGYPDNTFRPEQAITRAEVTAITNRMLNRHADLYWIDAHPAEVIRFGDVKRSDWYFEPIMEATMGHDFIRDRDGKTEHWTGLNGKSFI